MMLNAWREHFCGTVKPHSKSWPGSILPTMRTGLGTEAVPLLIISPTGHLVAATLLYKDHCLLLQAGCLMATPTRLQQYQKPEQRRDPRKLSFLKKEWQYLLLTPRFKDSSLLFFNCAWRDVKGRFFWKGNLLENSLALQREPQEETDVQIQPALSVTTEPPSQLSLELPTSPPVSWDNKVPV